MKNENILEKTGVKILSLKFKTQHLHTKLPRQRPMLDKWRVQNGPITKNEVLPLASLLF